MNFRFDIDLFYQIEKYFIQNGGKNWGDFGRIRLLNETIVYDDDDERYYQDCLEDTYQWFLKYNTDDSWEYPYLPTPKETKEMTNYMLVKEGYKYVSICLDTIISDNALVDVDTAITISRNYNNNLQRSLTWNTNMTATQSFNLPSRINFSPVGSSNRKKLYKIRKNDDEEYDNNSNNNENDSVNDDNDCESKYELPDESLLVTEDRAKARKLNGRTTSKTTIKYNIHLFAKPFLQLNEVCWLHLEECNLRFSILFLHFICHFIPNSNQT